jgi:hypothetical protein
MQERLRLVDAPADQQGDRTPESESRRHVPDEEQCEPTADHQPAGTSDQPVEQIGGAEERSEGRQADDRLVPEAVG